MEEKRGLKYFSDKLLLSQPIVSSAFVFGQHWDECVFWTHAGEQWRSLPNSEVLSFLF